MATFDSTFTDTFTVPVAPAVARDHFANPQTIIEHSNDVEEATVDGDVIHFTMKAQEHMGIGTFQSIYRCLYATTDNSVTWEPVGEGNTRQSGRAVFAAKGDGTEVTYSETLSVDMDVPKMMAPMLKPVIGAVLSHEMKEYTKRMRKTLEAL